MAADGKASYRVSFQQEGVEVTVSEGQTVLEACSLAGIDIDAVCGGEGKCGRCKVKLSGKHSTSQSPLLTPEEAEEGVVLACLTRVEGDLTIEVMPRSRIGRHQILTKSVEELPKAVSPWVSKTYLELPPATVSDNLADFDRLLRGLARRDLCMPLDTLKVLPGIVRQDGWKVTATITELDSTNEITRVDPGDTSGSLLGIAVDIGTTTVVVDLVDLRTGKVLATVSDYNRQTSRGEDVIARMMFAEERGMTELRLLVRQTINLLLDELVKQETKRLGRPVNKGEIAAASVAGNTIMTHFFTGVDTRFIRLEPYVPASYSMPCMKAGELGLSINPAARVMMFPARAGYVGGDVIADVLASGMHRSEKLALLIDVGTNGEIVLGGRDWMTSCSCSAGPAFEGGEVSCGMRAMEGAIEKIRINDDLSTSYHVIGDTTPVGICGSGLIDLMAELYAKGLVDRKARLQEIESERINRSDTGLEYVVEKRDMLGPYARSDLVITDSDLQNLMRTKAAIYGACAVLMKKSDEPFDELSSLIIAGGFGYHLDIGRAVLIGMFPDLPTEKYRFIGNGSLGGARAALISAENRREVAKIFDNMTYIELSTDNEFYDEFSSSLFIPHTDLSRFPSHPSGIGEPREAK
jgi:uncharacterized 2Fe-2S/4Fe-4S cluster protein (DUF4445 family)